MSYVRSVLQQGEAVAYATTLHWFVYLRAIWLAVLAVALGIATLVTSPDPPELRVIVAGAAGVAALVAAVAWLAAFVKRWTTELAVTDRRVIYKTGLIRRDTFEINLSKVESVGVSQSILGRLLGYGEVDIKGTGASLAPITIISNPLRFRSYITGHQ
jgi:uncharacterized membrane protein YdbT with pleckstrin-like domain